MRRITLPGVPQHIVQRGVNRAQTFFAPTNYLFYLDCLRDAIDRYNCDLHAYVLMSNHVHLMLTPWNEFGASKVMQSVGRRYVLRVNAELGRSGTLWEGRYKSTLVDSDAYIVNCMRYIEMNPVRANIVKHPADYRWSSFHANAGRARDPLIRPQSLYLELGRTDAARQRAYAQMMALELDRVAIAKIRSATQSGRPISAHLV